MATNRNLQFYGFAYGDTPVTLDVKVNGQTVFSNAVSTIPGAVPSDVNAVVCDQVLFELDGTSLFPITFNGHYTHSVAVSGGDGILIAGVPLLVPKVMIGVPPTACETNVGPPLVAP